MGQITGELFDTMAVPWEYFPDEEAAIEPVLQRAQEYLERERRPYALVMRKGTVAPCPLSNRTAAPRRRADRVDGPDWETCAAAVRPSRAQALARIIEATPAHNSVVIATTGFTGRELYAAADRENQLYMVGSMGCASSLGLGLALARPDLHVVVVDGDGAGLMRMGNMATLGAYGGGNLSHLLLDNEAHDSTGAQATVSAGVDFAGIAHACGYAVAVRAATLDDLSEFMNRASADGPRFVHLKITTGTIDDLPRPSITPAAVLERLKERINR